MLRVIAQKKAKIRPFFLVKPESAVLTNCLKTLAVCDQILSLRELFEQKKTMTRRAGMMPSICAVVIPSLPR